MKKIILILTLTLTINLTANPFNSTRENNHYTQQQVSQKFMYAQQAAQQGNARAQFDLGLMYAKGEGVRKDEKKAFSWFHKAARNNHVEAKFYMGLSFAQGRGVRKQAQLARYWFKLAVKAGHKQAIAYLATVENRLHPRYARGERVSFNSYR